MSPLKWQRMQFGSTLVLLSPAAQPCKQHTSNSRPASLAAEARLAAQMGRRCAAVHATAL